MKNPPPDNDPQGAPPNNHEAGNALVGMLTPGADPVRKISVMPRTMSLGATLSAPDGSTTSLARNMVGRFGMSAEIGFLSVLPQNGEGSGLQGYSDVSERTRQRIDDEMRRIVGEGHDDAVQLLADNRERLESLAEALFRAETLEGPEAYAAAGLQPACGATLTAEPATVAAS
jgi:cell division protease FtsH